jgi:hypothetical protein
LTVLALSGLICTDQRYTRELNSMMGLKLSRSAVQKHFKSKLGSRIKQAKLNDIDKFTHDNWMKHQEYLGAMFGVERERIRFYDQTGINFSDLMGTHERHIHGVAPLPARRYPRGVHYSFFGMTSLRLDMPAMFYKSYEAKRDNQQDGEDHMDYFLDAIDYHVLEPYYDIIVMDNWSAHVGRRGQELESFLLEDYGIPMVTLASRFSHLNTSEHSWRRGKGWARTCANECDYTDPKMARDLLGFGLSRITHADVLADMLHDGYGVEQHTIDLIKKYSHSSGPYIHPID